MRWGGNQTLTSNWSGQLCDSGDGGGKGGPTAGGWIWILNPNLLVRHIGFWIPTSNRPFRVHKFELAVGIPTPERDGACFRWQGPLPFDLIPVSTCPPDPSTWEVNSRCLHLEDWIEPAASCTHFIFAQTHLTCRQPLHDVQDKVVSHSYSQAPSKSTAISLLDTSPLVRLLLVGL